MQRGCTETIPRVQTASYTQSQLFYMDTAISFLHLKLNYIFTPVTYASNNKMSVFHVLLWVPCGKCSQQWYWGILECAHRTAAWLSPTLSALNVPCNSSATREQGPLILLVGTREHRLLPNKLFVPFSGLMKIWRRLPPCVHLCAGAL